MVIARKAPKRTKAIRLYARYKLPWQRKVTSIVNNLVKCPKCSAVTLRSFACQNKKCQK